jgi:hypothetical protein
MGGSGSGRHWHYNANSTVDNYRSIDIRKWRREGLLTPGTAFKAKWLRDGESEGTIQVLVAEKCLILTYRYRDSNDWIDANYPIDIEWTRCNLGGKRPWFRCPAQRCGHRVAVLYGGAIFACRNCYRLAYPSQRENVGVRATRKADKIRDRLGWEPGILNGEGWKPKGMHWQTFERLRRIHNELVNRSLKEATSRFGINMFDLY